jgi:hypothetical protein
MAIHLETHDHHVAEGKCRNVMEQVKFLVEEEVSHSLSATWFNISLAASKTFLYSTKMVMGELSLSKETYYFK